MKRRQSALVLGVALALAGCSEERAHRVAASYSSSTKPSAPPDPSAHPRSALAPQKLTVGIDAIPVEEDYETRAGASITEANLQAKLAELEQELRL